MKRKILGVGIIFALILTICLADCPAKDDIIVSLPFFSPEDGSFPCMYSGFLKLDDDRSMFYTFIQADTNPEDKPVVLWLQGGPGASGMFGMFYLNGPLRITRLGNGFTVRRAARSWTEVANLLFIDQPVGAGFSFTKRPDGYPKDQDGVSFDVYTALQEFLKKGHVSPIQKWFITSESYGGKYVPSVTSRIIANNDKIDAGDNPKGWIKIDVGGAMVGNGLVKPLIQRPLIMNLARALGYVGEEDVGSLKTLGYKCEEAVANEVPGSIDYCNKVRNLVEGLSGGIFMYDARRYDGFTSTDIKNYLNGNIDPPFTEDVKKAFNIMETPKNPPYTSPNMDAYAALNDDFGMSSVPYFDAILPRVRVLLYEGNFDLVDGPTGVEAWIWSLAGAYGQKFNRQPRALWKLGNPGKTSGFVKSMDNLTHIVIPLSGHYVPLDQPSVCIELLRTFLSGESFTKDPTSDLSEIRRKALNECNGKGTFSGATCSCEPGWGRADCSAQAQPFDADALTLNLNVREWKYYKIRVDNEKIVRVTNPSKSSKVTLYLSKGSFGTDDHFSKAAQIEPGATITVASLPEELNGDPYVYFSIHNNCFKNRIEGVSLSFVPVAEVGAFSKGHWAYNLTIALFIISLIFLGLNCYFGRILRLRSNSISNAERQGLIDKVFTTSRP